MPSTCFADAAASIPVQADELASFCEAARHATVAGDGQTAFEYRNLRRQFSELMEHARRRLDDPRLRAPQLAALETNAREAVAVAKLVYAELVRAETPSNAVLPPQTIGRMLDWNREQLARIDAQLTLLDRLTGDARELHDLVGELLTCRFCTPAPFRKLAIHIIHDARSSPTAAALLPSDRLQLKSWLIRPGTLPHRRAYAHGLLSARIIAWVAGRHPRWCRRIEVLTLAALLQDFGLLQIRFGAPADEARLHHPAVGAALAAGLAGYEVDLPRLIAQHHERADGTGYPAGLTSRRMQEDARLLGVVVRFVELRYGSSFGDEVRQSEDAAAAAAELYHEALQGEWDGQIVLQLLEALELPAAAAARGDSLFRDEFYLHSDGTRHRRDEPQPHPAHTHAQRANTPSAVPFLPNRSTAR